MWQAMLEYLAQLSDNFPFAFCNEKNPCLTFVGGIEICAIFQLVQQAGVTLICPFS